MMAISLSRPQAAAEVTVNRITHEVRLSLHRDQVGRTARDGRLTHRYRGVHSPSSQAHRSLPPTLVAVAVGGASGEPN